MLSNIYVPQHVKKGIYRMKKGYPNKINIFGADVETKPFKLLGFETEIIDVTDSNICEKFLMICNDYTKKDYFNVVWFHNLRFDLQAILKGKYAKFFIDDTFTLTFNEKFKYDENGRIKFEVRFGKSVSALIYFSKSRKLMIYDTFQYFKESLKKISIDLNLDHKKLDAFNEYQDYEDFKRYLHNDVFTVKDLGRFICQCTKEDDVPISISIAGNASKTFRHKFFKEDTWIPFIPNHFRRDVELSYHGGKNGYYLKTVTMVKNVKELDIISAYPYAMTKIPNFNHCDYILTKEYREDLDGVYCITGEIKKTQYQIFYSHNLKVLNKDFKPDKRDYDFRFEDRIKTIWVKNLRVTSYELKLALKYNLIKIEKITGFLVVENPDHTYNPIKEYALYYFEEKKRTSKKSPKYYYIKVKLNGLYGKFVEHIDYDRIDTYIETENGNFEFKEHQFKAGTMYNPMVASLITGFVRAYITELEIKYNSLHTSTDSIKTTIDISKVKELGNKLGDLTLEADGDCLFFRNKCYIHFTEDKIKCAYHGFHGKQIITGSKDKYKVEKKTFSYIDKYGDTQTVDYTVIHNLIKMYIEKKTNYKYERMGNIRESLKRKDKHIKVCDMNLIEDEFNVQW